MSATPAELLAAWRAAERRYAQAAAGSPEANALHAEMRRLMDEYAWAVRGRIWPGSAILARISATRWTANGDASTEPWSAVGWRRRGCSGRPNRRS